MIENGEIEPIEVAALDPTQAPQEVKQDEYLFCDDQFPVDEEKPTVEGTAPMRYPNLSLGEFSVFVLGHPKWWMKYRMRADRDEHVRDREGNLFPFKQMLNGRGQFVSASGVREWRLTIPDAERLAHLLYQNDQIDGQRLVSAVSVLASIAWVHGVKPRQHEGRTKR